MNEFITWEMLGDFVKLTGIVLAATQFTKNLPLIKKLPTKYLSWLIAFVLITVTNINVGAFAPMDIVLYALSAMFVGTSASGIYDTGKVKEIVNTVVENGDKITTVKKNAQILNEKEK